MGPALLALIPSLLLLSEVRRAEATKYRAFIDYGGYGVRLGLRG